MSRHELNEDVLTGRGEAKRERERERERKRKRKRGTTRRRKFISTLKSTLVIGGGTI
jgi:hypothetical protein